VDATAVAASALSWCAGAAAQSPLPLDRIKLPGF
jgi:hypothetical protein